MKADVLPEPQLEFAGGGRHVDPRFGVVAYGPADLEAPGAPRQINVGIVGTQAHIDALEQWLTSLREPIAGMKQRQPGLWPDFPGFRQSSSYCAEIVMDDRTQRPIRSRDIERLKTISPTKRINAAVKLYLEELETLVQDTNVDVVICHIPEELDEATPRRAGAKPKLDVIDSQTADEERPPAFHDLLKARAMPLRVPLQLVRARAYTRGAPNRPSMKGQKADERQDDATIAWNFLTALYYKAGGTPWRLVRESTDLTACFVGIAFFRIGDGNDTASSIAQVFNQRGDGVIVRGGPARKSNEDHQLHLSEKGAYAALKDAVKAYYAEHKTRPARVVVHKVTPFDDNERAGMLAAADDLDIALCELVWVTSSGVRLYRRGYHPPWRGTLLETARDSAVLYTRGTVEWYEGYPGMYVPRPVALRAAFAERGIREIADEVLALSKMNWNSTRFDGREPVTLRTARRVANIIKHLPEDAHLEPTYAYYM
ncbi:MAG TPA: hypothetical protein VN238_17720 [Solirubrobacteraceae bacterium]|nr:hypothetical protein [Solirubrobacteraceae bacterium]